MHDVREVYQTAARFFVVNHGVDCVVPIAFAFIRIRSDCDERKSLFPSVLQTAAHS